MILIVIDTLRVDHLGLYGYARPTSPRIDAWANEAAVFERAFATSPWTLPSFGSIYTGQLPNRHMAGMLIRETDAPASATPSLTTVLLGEKKSLARLSPEVPTLAELLRKEGYATGAVINNPFLGEASGLARGFETYDYVSGNSRQIRRADLTVDSSLAWIDAHADRPFFLVMHFFDPHMNYDAPPPFRGRFTSQCPSAMSVPVSDTRRLRNVAGSLSAADWRFITAAYDEEVSFVDDQIGRLLAALDARGLGKRALIVLVADHGEEFGDHGGFEHGHTAYNELLHVPLLVHGPGVRPGRVPAPVSLADLTPTILAAVDAAVPSDCAGVSLWSALTRSAALPARSLFAEETLYGPPRQAVVRWPLKLIVDVDSGKASVFDLARDPGEHVERAEYEREALHSLLEQAHATFGARRRAAAAPTPAAMDAATRERLRALGYLE